MIGHEGVTLALVEALSERLSNKTQELRDRLDLTGDELPDINAIFGHEPDSVGMEYWPMAVVSSRGTRDMRPMEEDNQGQRAWRVLHDVRVTVWVRGNTYEDTTATQQRLTLAVIECLLSPLAVTPTVRVDDSSFTTSMSDIATTESGRTLAGAMIDFTVSVEETLGRSVPLVDTVLAADTSLLPPVTA